MEVIGTNNNGDGVNGTSANGGAGVRGTANGANHVGVVGRSNASGSGVLGLAANGDGVNGTSANGGAGVRGNANGAGHDGVVGQSFNTGNGVLGWAENGTGVFGVSQSGGHGVVATAASGDGVNSTSENGGAGVRGNANGAGHDGVVGQSFNAGNGVLGWAENGTGVFAVSRGGGHGVVATATSGDGVNAASQGAGHGVSGLAAYGDASKIRNGVEGLVASGAGVLGTSSSVSVIGLVNPGGWHPETGLPNSPWSIGVCGAFQSGFPDSPGREAPLPWDIPWVTERVRDAFSHYGVYGMAYVGVLAATPFSGGYGLLVCNTAGGKAAAFLGDVEITGSVELTGQINTIGQDCAECFELADACFAEAGSVLVADEDGRLIESNTAYDRKVVGVVSGAGDHRPGVVLGGSRRDGGRQAAVALVGRVACKVDASYAAVEVGDLLTTSPTSGHAMKAGDAGRAFGCILGKALQPLRVGQGMVPILVALQ